MSNVTVLEPRRGGQVAAPPAPASVENEQAFLGALLLNNDVLAVHGDRLEPEHFTEDAHRRVFELARDMIRAGKVATPITMRPFIGEQEIVPGMTVAGYLARLAAEASSPLVAGSHAQIIIDLHHRRKLLAIADEARAMALDAPASTTVDGLIDKVEADLGALRSSAPVQAVTRGTAGEMGARLIEKVKRIRAGDEKPSGIPTGLPEIDEDTGGLTPTYLWIIAGRPSMGKTIFATKLARSVGRAGYGALLFSLEVGEEQINARLLADMAYSSMHPIPFRRIMPGKIRDEELWRLEDAQQRFDVMPMVLDCPSSATVSQIASKVRAERLRMAKRGVKLGAVIIDYLDFISAGDRYRGNRVYEVGEISRGLKQVAKDHDVCVILLAQINRQVEQRPDKRPMMSDLRDSGNLEQDADVVAMIYRESYYFSKTPEFARGDPAALAQHAEIEHDLDLIIGKNRAGATRTHRLWCDVACSNVAGRPKDGR